MTHVSRGLEAAMQGGRSYLSDSLRSYLVQNTKRNADTGVGNNTPSALPFVLMAHECEHDINSVPPTTFNVPGACVEITASRLHYTVVAAHLSTAVLLSPVYNARSRQQQIIK